LIITIFSFLGATVYFRNKIKISTIQNEFKNLLNDKLSVFFFIIIVLQVLINLVGVLGPEISFDALWYHLTIPKVFLLNHSIFHIPGNLLYYSDLPKLGELLYIPALSFFNEIAAKFVHFAFGLLCRFQRCQFFYGKGKRFNVFVEFRNHVWVLWGHVETPVSRPKVG